MFVRYMSNELLQYILGGSTNIFLSRKLGKNILRDVRTNIRTIKISIKQPDSFMQTILHFSDVKWNYFEYLRIFFSIRNYMHDNKEDDKL